MNQFPYTNFHDLNLDWLIKQTGENTTDITHVESEITTINSEIDALQSQIENISSLYLCTFGVTTNSEIEAALNDQKLPICIYSGHIYVISQRVSANRHQFGCVYRTESKALECLMDSWFTQDDTFASKAYVDSEIAAIPSDVFVAEYEVTSYADLLAAYNSGKYLVMKRQDDPDFPDSIYAVFCGFESDTFYFYDMNPTTRMFNRYRRNATDWYIQNQGTLAITNSPHFIGVPTAPTAAAGTDTTQIASTEFVQQELQNNFELIRTINPELIAGEYVNATNNTIGSSSNFSLTTPIKVTPGDIVEFTARGYNTVVGMIALCDYNNTGRKTVVPSIDNDDHLYTYTVTEYGYICCSFNNNYTYDLKIRSNYSGTIETNQILNYRKKGTYPQTILNGVDNKYIDNGGNVQDSSNFAISQDIELFTGDTINLTARGYNQSVSMISVYNSDGTYTPKIISTDSSEHTYTYTADKCCIVRCSYLKFSGGQTLTPTGEIIISENENGTITDLIEKTTNLLNPDPLTVIEYPQLYTNIICMGDSLTVGYDGNGSELADHNYPFYFEKLTHATITTQANGGYTSTQFWNAYSNYDYTPYDCAIIYLGTNGGLTDTVNTDCNNDYTQNANTNTGNYGKIIGYIKATAPNCKIFIIAGVNDYVRRETTMNPAVRALADFYNVGLIDISDCIMSDNGSGTTAERYTYRPNDGIHYNTFGYMTMANMIYDAMSHFISENKSMFKTNK